MKYNAVGWFEIPVEDMQRAQKFYEELFDSSLTYQKMDGFEMAWFPMDEEAIGSSGSLVKGEGYTPSKIGTKVYFSCPDIDATIKKAESLGVDIIVPKKDIGEYGYMAWIGDTEGNVIALHMAKERM